MSLQILIDNFNIKNYNNINNITLIKNFIKTYETIRESDKKAPIFTTTQKYNTYKARSVNFKKKQKENKNIWKKLSPETDIKRIESQIKGNLNKVNDDVYNAVLKDLIKKLLEINNICILQYFIEIIYDKIIFDKKFQKKYINMLSEISNNYEIYENYIDIYNEDKKIYYNVCGDIKTKNGPFNNKRSAIENSFKLLNLESIFISKLQKEFKKRYKYIEEMEAETDDECKYKLKRKYLGIFEVLLILYYENKLTIETIIIIITKLLKFKNVKYDIECLHILITKIKIKDKNINNDIKLKLEKIDLTKLPSRIKYLCYDINDIILQNCHQT